jgi:hypothetical protein
MVTFCAIMSDVVANKAGKVMQLVSICDDYLEKMTEAVVGVWLWLYLKALQGATPSSF